uniref:DUF3384 domain-containing protein n=1 Tax=Heterorhabditis bacteriophora TaxID=37862 RepID=A0A1I7XTL6_HETBA
MLSDPDTKEPALRAIIEMTETQHKQLGLALRHTFFEKISEIGCEELTLKWLNALSEFGRNVNGFEKDMDVLIADWIKHTLFEKDHPQSLLVLQLAQMFIQHNSAFIGDGKMTIIVHSVCIRACKTMEPLTKNCLDVLDSVLKYSDLPRGELMSVVTTICVLVCDPKFRQQAWALAKALLTSQIGHRTRKSLISILNGNGRRKGTSVNDEPNEKKMKRMLKGAVFCLANANWGTSQIDTVRCSPANVIEPMENAVKVDENICGDVLLALRRLIQKHGRDLQQITWIKLIHLFEVVIDLCENKPAYSSVCEESLHQLLLLTEQLYSDGHFAASADMLYDLIEKCADRRPDNSIIALIEYRAGAISELHAFYTRYRMLYEHELITQLMIPILQETENEKDSRIQYLMLNVLFDVAKTVSLRGDSLLFESVIALIRQLFNGSVLRSSSSDSVVDNEGLEIIRDENRIPTPESTVLSFDNLEIIAQGVGELLAERWLQLNLHTTNLLIGILVEHIRYQYDVGWTGEQGADVRVRVFSALLSIHCCPITNRLIRHGLGEDCPRVNMYITRRIDANNAIGFSWADICSVITDAATTDSWWPVLRAILQQLGRVLEHIQLVRTATDAHVDRLTQALVALYQRAERKEIALHITSDDKQLKGQIAKFLPPVLSTLAVMACDIAIQLAPSSMAGLALILTETLARLQSTAVRAIPIMELLSDSAEIPEFHKFFQVVLFKPYLLLIPMLIEISFLKFSDKSTYYFFRWFARVPEKMRHEIKCHMENSVRMSPLLPLQELSGVNRQPSGDGRQVENLIVNFKMLIIITMFELRLFLKFQQSYIPIFSFAFDTQRYKFFYCSVAVISLLHNLVVYYVRHQPPMVLDLKRLTICMPLLDLTSKGELISGIELHVVGVLYVGPQQESEADILSNTYGSDRYARFIKFVELFILCSLYLFPLPLSFSFLILTRKYFRLLGSPISLNNCPGGLLVGEHGSYTYEYIDELSRIVCGIINYVLATLMVIPYDTGSVLVQVHAKPEISCWLAMRRALLSDELVLFIRYCMSYYLCVINLIFRSAARLLRKMIVRTQLSVNVWRRVQEDPEQPYISQGVDRLRKIQAIKDKCGW